MRLPSSTNAPRMPAFAKNRAAIIGTNQRMPGPFNQTSALASIASTIQRRHFRRARRRGLISSSLVVDSTPCKLPAMSLSAPFRSIAGSLAASPLVHRHHVHGHFEPLAAGTEGDAAQRADVREIAAPGDGDVSLAGKNVVGGIGIHPAGLFTAEHRNPCVRGVRPDQPRPARAAAWFPNSR